VLIDYSKCDGDGACVSSCPGSIFETRERRCKPIDGFVRNTIALESFHGQILSHPEPVPVAIRYHVPECFLCWQCMGACPKQAIDVEYDDIDVRQHLVSLGNSATLTDV
jgi:ferredoxin